MRTRRREREPDVLELRIHGVNNTAPHDLLDLPQPDVERVAGDALGSFWRPTPAARARAREGERGHVPSGIVREAYSWGGLARTTPTVGSGAVGTVVGALGRIGWALLLPFGLVNVAFWSRRLDSEGWSRGWQAGGAAAALRVYALLLTLLMLGSVSVVSLDLVATQCFADSDRWCASLPAALDGLAAMSHGRRLALLSAVPLLVLLLLVGLSAISRTRYEQLAAMPVGDPAQVAAGTPLLATPGFWSNARLTATLGRMHIAGGLCFLVVATAWHQVFGTGPACADPALAPGAARGDCWAQVFPLSSTAWPFAVTLLLGAVGLIGIIVALCSAVWAQAAELGSRRALVVHRRVARVVAVCGALFVAQTLLLWFVPHSTAVEVPLLGLVAMPMVLTVVLLAIALAARGWRRGGDRRHEAWGGRAPSVFLLLALGVALTLSTLVVITVGDWLNGGLSAGQLVRQTVGLPGTAPLAPRETCGSGCPTPDPHLVIPTVYVWFGAATAVALVVVLAIALVAAVRTSATLVAAGVPRVLLDLRRRGGSATELARRDGAADAGRRARRAAAVAHRAEPVVRVLAEATLVCTSLAVLVTALTSAVPRLGPPQLRGVTDLSMGFGAQAYRAFVDGAVWGAGVTGLLVVGGLAGGALTGRTRPLGLVWDLICFLPRTGHPFGPPCYAERVVPELVRRYDEWLDQGPSRRTVVSAHSLGAVLAVASLFAAQAELGRAAVDRIALLTYGIQLRPYFGRMFPELLGPTVLGTAPGRGARLLTPDPWQDAVADDHRRDATVPGAADQPGRGAAQSSGMTVHGLLTGHGGTRWLNLWRRTDYLGFPVDSYGASTVDRPAEEIDTSGYLPEIATHGGYPRTVAYAAALRTLLGRSR
ncbi:hypothetical protein [Cellulomonas sp. KRMCY2]|uniref:hypothetical protein n=1 Tax=Cellulomonas sp. KRMCY2 TaxID=1304865 RepID=UPI00045EC35D|nr:hypothetical protein [Cellulomonas sp. KRMCY2]